MSNKDKDNEMVPAYLLEGSAWEQLWRSIGYFIRRVADNDDSLSSCLLAFGACFLATMIATTIVLTSLDDAEVLKARAESNERLIDRGVPSAVAACSIDGARSSSACGDILEEVAKIPEAKTKPR